MSQSVFKVTDSRTGFAVTIDVGPALAHFERAPRLTYKHLWSYFFEVLLDHREHWLAGKSNRFGRGSGAEGKPIGVSRVVSQQGGAKPNQVLYNVLPKGRKAATAIEAEDKIGQIRADIYTGNVVLPIHEEGRDIRTPKWMAIPIRTKPGTPKAWTQRNPTKRLVSRRVRGDRVLLFERQKPKKQRVDRDFVGPARLIEKWRLRFVLTKFVEMDPTLQFYQSWDARASSRDALWSRRLAKLERDIEYSPSSEL